MDSSWHKNGTLPVPSLERSEAQKRWEIYNTQEAIRKYRESLVKTVEHADGTITRTEVGLGDTEPGKRIMRDILGDLKDPDSVVNAIKRLAEESVERIVSAGPGGGRPDPADFVIPHMDPVKLAVIAVRVLLSSKATDYRGGLSANAVALGIGSAVRDEFEYEEWITESKERAKEEGRQVALVNILRASVKGNVNRRTFHRWKKKCSEIRKVTWSRSLRVKVGAALLNVLIEHGGGWFEMRRIWHKGHPERRVFMTEIAQEALTDMNTNLEVHRPFLLPMICEPRPWVRSSPLAA